jgi:hypothetical protein
MVENDNQQLEKTMEQHDIGDLRSKRKILCLWMTMWADWMVSSPKVHQNHDMLISSIKIK